MTSMFHVPAIGLQWFSSVFGTDSYYYKQIAPSRTFSVYEEVWFDATRMDKFDVEDKLKTLESVDLGAALFATATSSANAGVIDEYLEKSKANKELNDQKRLATSGANFAKAYTVQFGTCTFPYNFTGCQDITKQKAGVRS